MTREEEIKRKAAGVGILWRNTLVNEGLDRNVAETIASAIQKESINTAEWADKTIIEKVCEWLEENMQDYAHCVYEGEELTDEARVSNNMIEDLRKAMEQ